MLDGCVNSKNTVGFSTCLPMREMEGCVVVACWPTMFTIYMAGGGRPGTGESITTTFDVYVENATLLGMKGNEDD